MPTICKLTSIALALVFVSRWLGSACAVDHIQFERDGQKRFLSGNVLVAAQDGGRLVQTSDGVLWSVRASEIQKESSDNFPFHTLEKDEFAEQLLEHLPAGFRSHTTAHYVICYDTSRAYAVWCGGLFERLHRAFVNYWTRRGADLHAPKFPLAVIVFADANDFRDSARSELQGRAGAVLGYYSMQTNHVTMFDLTGIESIRVGQGERSGSSANISRMLRRPEAEPQVATIVHEATHQIAYNTGLQSRLADNPVWLSEGLAIYFETPDLSSSRGWRGIGEINYRRLRTYRKERVRQKPASLTTLLADDRRFLNSDTAPVAYAEAWALNYFLIRKHSDSYLEYVKMLAEKRPTVRDGPGRRLSEFKQYFGADFRRLEHDFRKYIDRLR